MTMRNAFDALDHDRITDEHASLMRRRQSLAELCANAERLAVGADDRYTRMRAAQMALSLRALVRYFAEQQRQVTARSRRH